MNTKGNNAEVKDFISAVNEYLDAYKSNDAKKCDNLKRIFLNMDINPVALRTMHDAGFHLDTVIANRMYWISGTITAIIEF